MDAEENDDVASREPCFCRDRIVDGRISWTSWEIGEPEEGSMSHTGAIYVKIYCFDVKDKLEVRTVSVNALEPDTHPTSSGGRSLFRTNLVRILNTHAGSWGMSAKVKRVFLNELLKFDLTRTIETIIQNR